MDELVETYLVLFFYVLSEIKENAFVKRITFSRLWDSF